MFPITDPTRAADIRMRRRRAIGLLTGIVVLPIVLVSGRANPDASHLGSILSGFLTGDQAENVETALRQAASVAVASWVREGAALPEGRRDGMALAATGTSLAISLPCAGSIAVVPGADLGRRIYVSLLDGGSAQAAGLELHGGDVRGGGEVALGGGCRHRGADLVVQAAPDTALTVTLTGGTSLRTGAFTGPVRLIQRGGGDVVIDAAGGLEAERSGGGDLVVGHLQQNLHLVQRGGGDTSIRAGSIGHADLELEGKGDLNVGPEARIGGLSLVMRGSGDVTIAHLDGSADIQATGSGDVAIAQAEARDVDISSAGSGDIAIAAGHVAHLAAAMQRSGDLSVTAEVGDASVQSGADSTITLPHVRGRLERSTSGG